MPDHHHAIRTHPQDRPAQDDRRVAPHLLLSGVIVLNGVINLTGRLAVISQPDMREDAK